MSDAAPGSNLLHAVEPLRPWLLVAALAVLLVIFWFLYRSERVGTWNWPMRRRLAWLRTAACVILAVAWGGWYWSARPTEPPELAFVVDRSRSMSHADADRAAELAALWESAERELKRDALSQYRMRSFTVGESLQPARDLSPRQVLQSVELTADASLLGDGLLQLAAAQRGRPTTAILFVTDGNLTAGPSLLSAAEELRRMGLPLFIWGVGANASRPDVEVSNIVADDRVFVGDLVRFETAVRIRHCRSPVTVRLIHTADGNVVHEQSITPSTDRENYAITLRHRPTAAGAHEYLVEAVAGDAEADLQNNRLTRTVQVQPPDLKVLLVWGYPSYEFRYLKTLLERELKAPMSDDEGKPGERGLKTVLLDADPEYADFDRTALRNFPLQREELNHYDVVILGDVPPQLLGGSGLENLRALVTEKGAGLAVIAGPRFGPQALADTPLAELLPANFKEPGIDASGENSERSWKFAPTALGLAAKPMLLMDDLDDSDRVWKERPHAFWHASLPAIRPGVRVLAEFRAPTGAAVPALTLQFAGRGRVLFQAGDESYRLRSRVGDLYFSRYWQQWIRYLAGAKLHGDQDVELSTDRRRYDSGEAVQVQIRFGPKVAIPVAEPAVTLAFEPAEGAVRVVPAAVDPLDPTHFSASVRRLPAGNYVVRLRTPALETPTHAEFQVSAAPSERSDQSVNETELQAAAELTGGKYARQDELAGLLTALPPAVPVVAGRGTETSLWNSIWPVTMLIGLLSAEWYWRKKAGLF